MEEFHCKIIRADGSETPGVMLAKGKKPTLKELREFLKPILEGGDLEHVSVFNDHRRKDMFVDEDGHGRGLSYNTRATIIYRHNWLTQRPGTDPETLPFIVGTAVLFDKIVWS